jgi:Tannase-like family of unknown function (DUF6351)
MPRRRNALTLLGATLVALCLVSAPAGAATSKASISVLSSRANLVSGHDALVRVDFSRARDVKGAKVTVGKRNVRKAFVHSGSRALFGVVKGLHTGTNVLTVKLANGGGARITLTDHPLGGPVLSGPQLHPWTCQQGARDAQCNEPPSFSYLYKSSDPSKSGFQPYDPKNPPSDVATTTTDQGKTVPFIVRLETGYIDRDQYKIATLFQPGKSWSATKPQPQFDHKLLITHGASCGVEYQSGTANDVTTGAAETALGRGYATMSNALDNSGHNCNLPLQAESLLMTKEHLIESYGTLRFTIGTGCSGGSLAEQWIANAYPGVYQGILPTCSFPDAWGTSSQFLDYHLTLAYFKDPSRWGAGVAWTPQQMADVQGHISIANSQVSDSAQFHVVVPTDHCSGVSDQQRYDPNTNPGGVRCSIADAAINVFGPRPAADWGPQEKKIGRGFAGLPADNVGVQYGLGALRSGKITPAQFVDLNAKIGGLDIDTNPVPGRISATRPALANAYRSGMINETNNLDQTAIIDCRGPDPGAFHDAYRAFAVRARLDREHGNHSNQLIWEGPVLIKGDSQCELNSFAAMDRWLSAVEKDKAHKTLPQKIASDKPSDLGDRCYDGNGNKVSDGLCGEAVVPIYGTPRTVAGDKITTDTNKCQLRPLNRNDDYGSLPFTDDQWAQLQQLFPNGVCDFSKPGVDQQGTIAWQTYQHANGSVIYGGRGMGAGPRSRSFKPKR